MYFIKPEIQTFKFNPVVLTQTSGTISRFSLGDEGCPTINYENNFPGGTYNFSAVLQLSDNSGVCGTVELSGTGTVSGNTLSVNCETLQANCINVACNFSPDPAYQVCLQSATVDGVQQMGLPLCDSVNAADLQAAVNFACS